MKKTGLLWLAILAIFIANNSSCRKSTEEKGIPATPYTIEIPFGFPKKLNIPADNPMTVEGVELGRYLFYDGRMSGRTDPDSLMSCSTCHIQANSFTCGIDNPAFEGGHPHGVTGIPTPHYMLPLINLVWNSSGYLWNGFVSNNNPDPRYRNIESIVYMSVIALHEMNSDTTRSVEVISGIPGYAELFKKAFGTPDVTFDRISKAIAQFIRTLTSTNSRFDKYMRGELQLTPAELNGFVLLSTEQGGDCFHCHGGSGNPLFTTNLFYNNAKDSVFTDTRDRYSVTHDPMNTGAYKAPTLRNVELTAPYMHDGRFKTLDEVIDFYSGGLINSPYVDPLMHYINSGGAQLTSSEKADLKAFIHALRDDEFLTNLAFSRPEKLPGE
jgi:cytochrome c peroxidase